MLNQPTTFLQVPKQPSLREPKRVASASIRGYCFQFLHTLDRWIGLDEGERLFCEGNEDIDRMLLDNQVVEEQVKHLKGNLTDTSEVVAETLLNFARGFTLNYKANLRSCHVLRTTADLGAVKHSHMRLWLTGQALSDESIHIILDYACSKALSSEDDASCGALLYIRENNLSRDFLESCE